MWSSRKECFLLSAPWLSTKREKEGVKFGYLGGRSIWKKWDERSNDAYNICHYLQKKGTEMKIYIFEGRIQTKFQITIESSNICVFSNYLNKIRIINLKKINSVSSYIWVCAQLCMSEYVFILFNKWILKHRLILYFERKKQCLWK